MPEPTQPAGETEAYNNDWSCTDDDWDDRPDDDDPFEDALSQCGRGHDYTGCTLAGSEYCDFECPFSR